MHTSGLVEPSSFLGTFKFEFAPAGEMEFLNSNGETENISLQDMIECDIKSEFNDHLGKLDGLDTQTSLLDAYNLNFHENSQVSMSTINTLDLDSTSKLSGDFNWLQGININTIQQLDQPENTDPNLLVNPSTGLPVSIGNLVSCTQDSPSPVDTQTTVTLIEQADQTAVLATPNTVQYIGIPTSVPNQNCLQSPVQVQPQHQHIDIQYTPQQSQLQQQLSQTVDNCKTLTRCEENKIYPKPVYSYSCLIAMALKNSETGCLPVSEIYSFMTENFPYFKTAPDGWKNSVRHNLSLNKCFEKIENPKSNGTTKKGCLWAMNPAKIEKMEDEIAKWRKKDPVAIHKSMAKPERLDSLEKGHQTPKKNANRNGETPIKIENVIKMEENANTIKSVDLNELFNGEVSPEDIQMLEHSLHMDPTLSDLAIQNGLLDELNSDVFGSSAEEVSVSQTLSNSFTMSSAIVSQLIAPVALHSPAASPMKTDSPKLQGPYLYSPSYSRLDNKTTRTVSALT